MYNKCLWTERDQSTDFNWFKIIIDKTINDSWKVPFNHSFAQPLRSCYQVIQVDAQLKLKKSTVLFKNNNDNVIQSNMFNKFYNFCLGGFAGDPIVELCHDLFTHRTGEVVTRLRESSVVGNGHRHRHKQEERHQELE